MIIGERPFLTLKISVAKFSYGQKQICPSAVILQSSIFCLDILFIEPRDVCY